MIANTAIDLFFPGRRVPASLTRDDQWPHLAAYGTTSLTLLRNFESAANP